MKKYLIILLLLVGLLVTGCVTTASKYKVGTQYPHNRYARYCSNVLETQHFLGKTLEVHVEPDVPEDRLIITVKRPIGSRVNDMSYPGNIKLDLIYLNQEKEIIHVIHKERSVTAYPVRFADPIPRSLEVSYISIDWHVTWYN